MPVADLPDDLTAFSDDDLRQMLEEFRDQADEIRGQLTNRKNAVEAQLEPDDLEYRQWRYKAQFACSLACRRRDKLERELARRNTLNNERLKAEANARKARNVAETDAKLGRIIPHARALLRELRVLDIDGPEDANLRRLMRSLAEAVFRDEELEAYLAAVKA